MFHLQCPQSGSQEGHVPRVLQNVHVDLHVEFQIIAGGKMFSVGLAAVRLLSNVPADVAFQVDCLNCFERLH